MRKIKRAKHQLWKWSREQKVAGRSKEANPLVQERESVESLKQLAFPEGIDDRRHLWLVRMSKLVASSLPQSSGFGVIVEREREREGGKVFDQATQVLPFV